MRHAIWIVPCVAMALGAAEDIIPLPTYADVDWDAELEPLSFLPDAPGGSYPWQAPRVMAAYVPRVEMGLENLRETIYVRGRRVLDEGYWYGDLGGPSEKYAALYATRRTSIEGNGVIVTRWQSPAAILKRMATLTPEGCDLRYRLWLAPANEDLEAPDGEVCMGILWHREARQGTVEEAIEYMVDRIAGYRPACAGITDPSIEFALRYTFDDTIKAAPPSPSPALLAWDGKSPYDYYAEGITYEDERFAPSTPAVWGLVAVEPPSLLPVIAPSVSLVVRTGDLDREGRWYGVGPGGRYSQEGSVIHRQPFAPKELFVRGNTNDDPANTIDITDLIAFMRYLFGNGGLACYDAGDVNDDAFLTLEDAIFLASYLYGPVSRPPFPPFPEPGPDPTPDNIRRAWAEPPDPWPACTDYVLSLDRDGIVGDLDARFVVNLDYRGEARATQAHAALRYQGIEFVSARPAAHLPSTWHVGVVDFGAAAVGTGELGVVLFNTQSNDPSDLTGIGRVPVPEGPIIELTFRPRQAGFSARLESYVGRNNLYCYSGVGAGGHPFIPCALATDLNFKRGDANVDHNIDIGDAVTVLAYLFAGGTLKCEDAADSNDNGGLDIADAIYILSYLYGGGPPPPPPFPWCGPDPTPDALDCEYYPQCGDVIVPPPAQPDDPAAW